MVYYLSDYGQTRYPYVLNKYGLLFSSPYLSSSLSLDPLGGDGAPAHCLVGKGTHGRSPLLLSIGGGTKQ